MLHNGLIYVDISQQIQPVSEVHVLGNNVTSQDFPLWKITSINTTQKETVWIYNYLLRVYNFPTVKWHRNIDQTLVNSLYGLLNFEIPSR